MKDYAEQDRQEFLAKYSVLDEYNRILLARVESIMGDSFPLYICHPANRVKRLAVPLRDSSDAMVLT
jgi:hypothetical protein